MMPASHPSTGTRPTAFTAAATRMPRVVLLSKDHRLTHYLEARLADVGALAGVVYEERLRTPRERFAYARGIAKREGIARTVDIILYELWDGLARGGAFRRAAERIVPLPADDRARMAVPRHVVRSLNAPDARALIASLEPDLLVVHATGILKAETFGLARVAALNVHCGVLPEYRGHASTFWALSRGDTGNIGVTVHLVAKTVDTGLLVRQGRVTPEPGDDDLTLWFKSFRLGTDLVVDAVHEVASGAPLSTRAYEGATGPHYGRKGFLDYVRYRLGRRPIRPT